MSPLQNPNLDIPGGFGWMKDEGENGWDISDDTLRLSTIKFNIIASTDSLYHVVLRRHSFGETWMKRKKGSEDTV